MEFNYDSVVWSEAHLIFRFSSTSYYSSEHLRSFWILASSLYRLADGVHILLGIRPMWGHKEFHTPGYGHQGISANEKLPQRSESFLAFAKISTLMLSL